MRNAEKIIWEYLDGDLSPQEKAKLDYRLQTDSAFLTLYNHKKKVHEGLQSLDIEKAPEHILSNVMVSLKNESIYLPKTTKFTAFKYFSLFFIALNVILIAWGLFSSPATNSNFLVDKFNFLKEPLIDMDKVMALPFISPQFLLYGVAVGLLVMLFWGDFIIHRNRVVRSRG